MPSSLIFTGLVVLWLLILVPAVALHQQEVARPSSAALSGRVLQRRRIQEVDVMYQAEATAESPRRGGGHEAYVAEDDFQEPPPRYRPGRGGFDAEAAALAARARYAFRQRVVLGMLVTAAVTAIVAAVALPGVWWLHAGLDVALVGYLVYLRRQVRMEEAIRSRRASRMAGTRRRDGGDESTWDTEDADGDGWVHRDGHPDDLAVEYDDELETFEPDGAGDRVNGTGVPVGMLPARPRDAARPTADAEPEPALPRLQPAPPPPLPAGTSIVEIGEDDPEQHDLDGPAVRDHQRAVGE